MKELAERLADKLAKRAAKRKEADEQRWKVALGEAEKHEGAARRQELEAVRSQNAALTEELHQGAVRLGRREHALGAFAARQDLSRVWLRAADVADVIQRQLKETATDAKARVVTAIAQRQVSPKDCLLLKPDWSKAAGQATRRMLEDAATLRALAQHGDDLDRMLVAHLWLRATGVKAWFIRERFSWIPALDPVPGSTVVTAERNCLGLLLAAMRAAPDAPRPKPECRQLCADVVSDRAFDRLWTKAAEKANAPKWSRGGRRPEPPQ